MLLTSSLEPDSVVALPFQDLIFVLSDVIEYNFPLYTGI